MFDLFELDIVPMCFEFHYYFLVRKLYQETGGHMLTTKNGSKPIRLGQPV